MAGYFFGCPSPLGLLAGSFGVFLTLILLFVRFLPTISIAELKAVALSKQSGEEASHG